MMLRTRGAVRLCDQWLGAPSRGMASSTGETSPLTRPLSGLPQPVYTPSTSEQKVTVSKLSSGLTVASVPHAGRYASVGIAIKAGSRYEDGYPLGVSHVLEKLAFQSTAAFPGRDTVLRELERYGGVCDCQVSRDAIIYAVSAEASAVNTMVRVLVEAVLRPCITPTELEAAIRVAQFETQSAMCGADQEDRLSDLVHHAAFGPRSLGLPRLCPTGGRAASQLTRRPLLAYIARHYQPSRMVLTGVNAMHGRLIESAERYLSGQPAWATDSSGEAQGSWGPPARHDKPAEYRGGVYVEPADLPLRVVASGGELPTVAHVSVALKGCSSESDDMVAQCVLNMLLGGGGAFSSGGPGKGMYSRLYTRVLNQVPWVNSASAFTAAYSDAGLLGIHASAPPERVRRLVHLLLQELASIAQPSALDYASVRRAKTQLKSVLLMNLESRSVVLEDVCRQLLSRGCWKPPSHYVDLIEKIRAEDLRRVATRGLASLPSLAARGDVSSDFITSDEMADVLRTAAKTPPGR